MFKKLSKDKIKEIKDLFLLNYSIEYICNKQNISKSTAYRHTNNPKPINHHLSTEIQNLYLNGLSSYKISEKLKISQYITLKILKQNKITRNASQAHIKHHINENFFENIDTPLKAQIFGLICADGCVSNNHLIIGLSEIDGDYLKNIKNSLQSTHKITITKRKSNLYDFKPMHILNICRQKIYKDLIKNGCHERKSQTLQFPIIKEELIKDFIRGYFEGDGGITKWKRINTFNYCISFCATKQFCERLMFYISKFSNIDIKYMKIYKCKGIFSLRFQKQTEVLKFLNWIYDQNNVFFMKRKYEKYLEMKENYKIYPGRNENGNFIKNHKINRWLINK